YEWQSYVGFAKYNVGKIPGIASASNITVTILLDVNSGVTVKMGNQYNFETDGPFNVGVPIETSNYSDVFKSCKDSWSYLPITYYDIDRAKIDEVKIKVTFE
ncbi:MAG: hypothetical protein J1E29_04035, partial [Duncaniella sp.]|nr:hypothetical protein [Duncaniella sp.]